MDIAKILAWKHPGAEWALNGDSYEGLVWMDKSPKPTEAELIAAWPDYVPPPKPKSALERIEALEGALIAKGAIDKADLAK